MTVYVDELLDHGWNLRNRPTKNCHLFTDSIDLTELHSLAEKIGMKRSWFQVSNSGDPHYDLTPARRASAIQNGAVAVENEVAVGIWRRRREESRKPFRCCEKAVQIPCVCAWAWKCEEHGELHVGSHE
jgi:hypothetical protein